MPMVDGEKFPYTAEGKKRAFAAAKAKKTMPYKPSDKTPGMVQKKKKKMGGY
jgi:hypothetical protein